MRHHPPSATTWLLALLAAPVPALPPDGGRRLDDGEASDRISPELDRQMVAAVDRNLATLRRQGWRKPPTQPQVSGLIWPLGPITRPTRGTTRITWVDCEHAVAELDGSQMLELELERLGRTAGLDCQ